MNKLRPEHKVKTEWFYSKNMFDHKETILNIIEFVENRFGNSANSQNLDKGSLYIISNKENYFCIVNDYAQVTEIINDLSKIKKVSTCKKKICLA